MKFKYALIVSLVSPILWGGSLEAFDRSSNADEQPKKGSKGSPPRTNLTSLPRQKTRLPWGKMTPEHHPAPKSAPGIPVS